LNKKIHLVSLGCAKNLVDSERLLASALGGLGLEAAPGAEEADLIVLNTCAFLESAVKEALETLMDLGARKKAGGALMVCGCLPARYHGPEGEELIKGLPEVDLWLRPDQYHNFEKSVAGLLGLKNAPPAGPSFQADGRPVGGRILGTPFFRAYLKIAEGCDNRCRYCLIPSLRGPLKSYPAEGLVKEAGDLVDGGVRELTLVAQDLTAYGRDLGRPGALPALVRELSARPGLDWLRLLYAYPERLSERLVKDLAGTPKVVPYLDLPFQHASPEILKRMGRNPAPPLRLVENLRRWWPGLALRSTFIVGLPGETEERFAELESLVAAAAFDHLGVFKYSPEPGTPAAGRPDQTPQSLKEKRRRRIMAAQRKISLARNRARLGQIFPVLVEGPAPDSDLLTVGRAPFQAPEVDGLIYFEGEQPRAGQIVETEIIRAAPYDLVGRLRPCQ
jgi:ribosomal protein S12 methylthiotransferase